jgi:predicted PurR-regulated permease PerM
VVRSLLGGLQRLASFLTLIVIAVVVALPLTIIGILVYSEAIDTYLRITEAWPTWFEDATAFDPVEWLRDVPLLEPYLQNLESVSIGEALQQTLRRGSQLLLTITRQSLTSISQSVFHAFIVALLLFFLFVDGPKLLAWCYHILPMANHELREIFREAGRMTSATLVSTLVIGLLEGAFGTALFAIFGLPSPFLWGIVIVIFSMIPVVGSNLVIAPAGIVLFLQGRVLSGVVLIVLGFAGVAMSQNLIKPWLLGGQAGLHPAVVLLATIGGIAWLGLIGVLVGPVVASLTLVVWRQFSRRYRRELSGKEAPDSGESGSGGGDGGSATRPSSGGGDGGSATRPSSGEADPTS